MTTPALVDCEPCNGSGAVRSMDLPTLLLNAHLPEHEQAWQVGPCPLCLGTGASVKPS